jgi:hypothetical protein
MNPMQPEPSSNSPEQAIGEWLESIGLAQDADAFAENDITFETLALLTAEDLKEIGVTSLGNLKKLLAAFEALSKHGHSERSEDGSGGEVESKNPEPITSADAAEDQQRSQREPVVTRTGSFDSAPRHLRPPRRSPRMTRRMRVQRLRHRHARQQRSTMLHQSACWR